MVMMENAAAASAAWMRVTEYRRPEGWQSADCEPRAGQYCSELEHGKILFFSAVPFDLPEGDCQFLLSQKQTESRFHKNISYRPVNDVLRGVADDSPDRQRLHQIMRHFSQEVTQFLRAFLAPYADRYQMDYASFRPLEEQGRDLPTTKRNDLLHFDAFPTRPTHGGRILRIFVNINPAAERVWLVGDPFHELTPRLAGNAGLARFASPSASQSIVYALERISHRVGFPVPDRSPYDRFMLHYHDWLKANTGYQQDGRKTRVSFPPGSVWLVYTDGVPHAVLSGRYALEQTYIIPPSALVAPEAAPVRVLEKLAGKAMAAA
jgi:hypothetical protein